MKYLVLQTGVAEDYVLCNDEREAIELIETKLRDGCAESDLQIFAAEPVNFQVERVPVVKLSEEAVTAPEAKAEVGEYAAEPLGGYDSEDKQDDINPFVSEQVFSLDS